MSGCSSSSTLGQVGGDDRREQHATEAGGRIGGQHQVPERDAAGGRDRAGVPDLQLGEQHRTAQLRCTGAAGRAARRRPSTAGSSSGSSSSTRAPASSSASSHVRSHSRRSTPYGGRVGSATSTAGEQLLEAVGVERVALQPLAGEEEGGERLERQALGVGVARRRGRRREPRTRRLLDHDPSATRPPLRGRWAPAAGRPPSGTGSPGG